MHNEETQKNQLKAFYESGEIEQMIGSDSCYNLWLAGKKRNLNTGREIDVQISLKEFHVYAGFYH